MQTSAGLHSQANVKRPDAAAGNAVALVASAGGVVALGEVLAALPHDLGAALIVVLHLLPEHRSHLAEILGRQTNLRVKEAEDGDLLETGCVFVAPPDAHLFVEGDGTLSLRSDPPVRHLRPNGDLLLESLASGGTDEVSLARALVLVGLYVAAAVTAAALVFARRDVTA